MITKENITLRNKTSERLSEEEIQTLKESLVEILNNYSGEQAEQVIWKLTYDPTNTAANLGFSSEISGENILVVRNEIRSRYQAANPGWVVGSQAQGEAEQEACKVLRTMFQDECTIGILLKIIKNIVEDDNTNMGWFLGCLRSRWETSKYKVVWAMGFNEYEREYLWHGLSAIGDAMEILYKDRRALIDAYVASAESTREHVAVGTMSMHANVSMEKAKEHSNKAIETSSVQLPNVISKQPETDDYFKLNADVACENLRQIQARQTVSPGFILQYRKEVEQILAHSSEIIAFLKANDAYVAATRTLLNAEHKIPHSIQNN